MVFAEYETPPEWSEVLPIIEELTKLSGISLHRCADVLQCEFRLIISNRFEGVNPISPFRSIDIRKRSAKTGIIVLDFIPGPHLEFYAAQVKTQGQPLEIDIVSPPLAEQNHLPLSLAWDRKYGWCYVIHDRRVWYGFEEFRDAVKLVSVAIYFDEEFR